MHHKHFGSERRHNAPLTEQSLVRFIGGPPRRMTGSPDALEGRCCLVAQWVQSGAAVLSSAGVGEFRERLRDPVTRIDIKAEFAMAAVQVLDKGMPCADYSGGAQPFQTAYRPQPGSWTPAGARSTSRPIPGSRHPARHSPRSANC